MPPKSHSVGIVILAAGKGKRMQSDLPKVMHLFKGKPLVEYVVKVAEDLKTKPVVVVNPDHNLVKDYLTNRAECVIQDKQLGTGHAVMCAEEVLAGKSENVVVLYGDMPFIKSDSIRHLIEEHKNKENTLTLMTVKVDDFNDWKSQFADFGRIIRNENGQIIKIVEKKDATSKQLETKEVNPAYFCFKANWLWKNLKNLSNTNAQGEYYLTDLVEMALGQNANISSVDLNPREAIGINTKEHLNMIKNLN